MTDHLGADAFFDIRQPNRKTRARRLELTTSVGGVLGGVSNRPISQDFIRSQEEARWFVEHVLELVGRLRSRLGDTLDFSPRSLRALDALAKRDERPQRVVIERDLVLELAAYYGEVVRRNLGGSWEIAYTGAATPLIVLPSPLTDEDPFVRVVKLLEDRAPLLPWYELVASVET